nr:hypothetical protein [uncultured Acetatifactor sp.]
MTEDIWTTGRDGIMTLLELRRRYSYSKEKRELDRLWYGTTTTSFLRFPRKTRQRTEGNGGENGGSPEKSSA